MNRLEGNIVYDKIFEKEYVLSRQILRSWTSIGANISEAIYAQSGKDFLSKMYIAFKETSETRYWLNLLESGKFLNNYNYTKLLYKINEIINALSAITITTKQSHD